MVSAGRQLQPKRQLPPSWQQWLHRNVAVLRSRSLLRSLRSVSIPTSARAAAAAAAAAVAAAGEQEKGGYGEGWSLDQERRADNGIDGDVGGETEEVEEEKEGEGEDWEEGGVEVLVREQVYQAWLNGDVQVTAAPIAAAAAAAADAAAPADVAVSIDPAIRGAGDATPVAAAATEHHLLRRSTAYGCGDSGSGGGADCYSGGDSGSDGAASAASLFAADGVAVCSNLRHAGTSEEDCVMAGTCANAEVRTSSSGYSSVSSSSSSSSSSACGDRLRSIVLFSGNDYLGLASHPSVRMAAARAALRQGMGPRASALVCGYTEEHERLEAALAALKGTEDCLLCPTGFAANMAVLSSLAPLPTSASSSPSSSYTTTTTTISTMTTTSTTISTSAPAFTRASELESDSLAIFSDELNHASIIDGIRLLLSSSSSSSASSPSSHSPPSSSSSTTPSSSFSSPPSPSSSFSSSSSPSSSRTVHSSSTSESMSEQGSQQTRDHATSDHATSDHAVHHTREKQPQDSQGTAARPPTARRRGTVQLHVYRHNDMHHLEELLRGSTATHKAVVTDSLFSMDGDFAPLPILARLRERYGFLLVVDEAHATLVCGDNGSGAARWFGMEGSVDLHVGTLSKAVGAMGGFVACSREWKQLIQSRGRAFIFSTALPLPVVCAATEALAVAQRERWRQRAVWDRARQLSRELGMEFTSPICPIVIGGAEEALAASRELLEAGFHVPAIRPPTVPAHSCRLRVALSAAHRPHHISALAAVLRRIVGRNQLHISNGSDDSNDAAHGRGMSVVRNLRSKL